ncbi:MAG: aminopeptidase, partial [Burkholderiales bacterium]
MRKLVCALVAGAVLIAAGCSNLGYYMQSIEGQLTLLQSRQQIDGLLDDPATPAELKTRLQLALKIRDFASSELHLPDNQSYRSYANLQRQFVVWNVFAAAEFSIEPEQWCFPIAGCVGYRGYFTQAGADEFASGLREHGLDVFVGGVPAYSTLGWFDDPVLNTFVNYSEHEIARLLFHELAHQVAYAGGDSEFNESFAVTVETEGVRRWIDRHGDAKIRADFARAQVRRAQFAALVLKYRERLGELYDSGAPAAAMRERKAAVFAELSREYQALRTEWGGFKGYDKFFDDPNNA